MYDKAITFHNATGGPAPARVLFYSAGQLFEVNGSEDPLENDLIDINTEKDLEAPTGCFTLTLHNRPLRHGSLKGKYLADVVEAMDMVVIAFRRGSGDTGTGMLGVMVGVVGSKPREKDGLDENNAKCRHVIVQGFDMGKLLLNARLYFFKDIPNSNVELFTLKGLYLLKKLIDDQKGIEGTKEKIVQILMENVFYPMTSLSYQRPKDSIANVRQVLDYKLCKSYGKLAVLPQFFTQEDSLYGFISNFVEKPWCEFWVDTWPDDPAFVQAMCPRADGAISTDSANVLAGARAHAVFRETPFDRADWDALPRYTIDDRHVIDVDFGGEPTLYNVFYVRPSAFGAGASDLLNKSFSGVPLIDEASTRKHGFRQLVVESKVFPSLAAVNMPEAEAVAAYLTNRLYTWFAPSPTFRCGSITVQGNPLYRVGTRLRYYQARTGRVFEFYIEGVTHCWRAFGGYTTTLRITRGLLVTEERFPAPLRALAGSSFIGPVQYPLAPPATP